MMIGYHLKTGYRSLLKNKKLFLINIGGLAFGLSICLAIMLFFLKEYSFDRYHANTDFIYRLVDKDNSSSAIDYRTRDLITENFPEVENACLIQILPAPIHVSQENNGYYLENILSTDNAFFEMFSVPFVKGNQKKPFSNIHSAVLTERAAHHIFGTQDPIGKEINVMHAAPVIVTGVISDFPDNSSVQADILVNGENDAFKFSMHCTDCTDSTTIRRPFRIYLQLNEHTKTRQFVGKMNDNIHNMEPYVQQVDLLSLKDMYLNDSTYGSRAKKGDPRLLNILGIIGIIILSLAFINYNNLLMARQSKRNKETGVRKIFGAFSKDLYGHFFAESILLIFLAFIAALIILSLSLPFYENVFDRSLDIRDLLQFPVNVFLLLAILLLGIIAGASPALVYSSFNPLKIFRGETFYKGKKSHFRNSLTTFQFAVSIGLIACLIVIRQQIQFVKEKKIGFSEEQLLCVDIPSVRKSDLSALIKNLTKYPEVLSASRSNGVPGQVNIFMGSGMEGKKEKSVPCIFMDSAFINTFEIKLIEGRMPTPSEIGSTCLINKAALDYFEWDSIEGKIFNNGRPGGFKILGVVNDFHFNSLHNTIEPLCLMFMDVENASHLNVRLAGNNVSNGLDDVQKEWKEVLPDYAFKYKFYDEWFDAMYRQEEKFAKTIALFALLAISISGIGILGLAMFNAETRTREIGIRKVFGASISNILLLLTRDFAKLVTIAFIIAIPIANYFIAEWLAAFAYRVEIQWWLFIIPGALVLIIAFLIVGIQSLKAAVINPTDSLRNE